MKQQSESMLDLKNRERAASMATIQDGLASVENEDSKPAIDDRGTNQSEAAQILQGIRDAAFDSSDEKLAIALGRASYEIAEWLNGEGNIDSDALMALVLPRRKLLP